MLDWGQKLNLRIFQDGIVYFPGGFSRKVNIHVAKTRVSDLSNSLIAQIFDLSFQSLLLKLVIGVDLIIC